MLYEMMTGRRPFAGDTRSALIAAIVGARAAGREPPAGHLTRLERAIDRCLAKDKTSLANGARPGDRARWIARWCGRSRRAVAFLRPALATMLARPRRWSPRSQASCSSARRRLGRRRRRRQVHQSDVPAWRRVVRAVHARRPDLRIQRELGRTAVQRVSWPPEGPDARDLSLQAGRILSISPSNDMAVLFGPQNVLRAFGARTLGGFRWPAAHDATCSTESWMPIGSQERTNRCDYATRGMAVHGGSSSRRTTSSMKHAQLGRCAFRPTGAASPSSRGPDCSRPSRRR